MKRTTTIAVLLLFSGAAPAENSIYALTAADRLEYQESPQHLLWDMQGWIGGDVNKFWWKTEGEHGDGNTAANLLALYSRAVSPYFDLQMGVRQDFGTPNDRTYAAFGVQGLARQWIETDVTLLLAEDGDLSVDIEAEYDLYLTQRWVLQPRLALNAGTGTDAQLALGSGLRAMSLDLRLRYEWQRKFAPYVGVSWTNLFGDTRDAVVGTGREVSEFGALAGLRFWF